MDDRAAAIEMICAALTDRGAARAEILAGEVYPFVPIVAVLRRANIAMALQRFNELLGGSTG